MHGQQTSKRFGYFYAFYMYVRNQKAVTYSRRFVAGFLQWWFITIQAIDLCWTECHWKKFSSIFPCRYHSTNAPYSSSFSILLSPGAELNAGHFQSKAILLRTRPQYSTGQNETPTFVFKKICSNCSFVFLCRIMKIITNLLHFASQNCTLCLAYSCWKDEWANPPPPGKPFRPLNFSVPLKKFLSLSTPHFF